MTLAEEIVVLRNGQVEQFGTPLHRYEDPDNSVLAQFKVSLHMNLFRAVGRDNGSVSLTEINNATFTIASGGVAENTQLLVGISPENQSNVGTHPLKFKVDIVSNLDGASYVCVKERYEDEPFCIEQRRNRRSGDGTLTAHFDPDSALQLDATGGLQIR